MENATKALIIAAAILIAIVLISLGVFVLGQGSTMVQENSDMTATQVSTYNSKWEAFLGTKVSGSKVKQLINTVNQHNDQAEDDSKKIVLSGITSVSDVKIGDTYKVEVDTSKGGTSKGYTSAGLIKYISITSNSSTTTSGGT